MLKSLLNIRNHLKCQAEQIHVFYVYKAVLGKAGGVRDNQMKGKQVCRTAAETGEVSSSLLQEKEVSGRQEGSVIFSFAD